MRFYRQQLHLKPDFFICDAFDDPCIDTAVQFKTPFAITCSGILHQDISVPYMNGLGTTEHATSESMTLWQRFHHKYVDFLKTLYYLYPELKELDTLRQQFGIPALGLNRFKQWDNALKLINSYFGFTPPQVLGPLTHLVGPVMTSKQKPLSHEEQAFLDSHSRVAYVAFGQYALPSKPEIELLMSSLLDQVERKQLDGIIWAGLKEQVAKYESRNPSTVWKFMTTTSTFDLPAPLFENYLSQDVFMPSWANQFSVLGHASTVLFVSHGGATSANEATFHGVPLLVHPFVGDQRLVGRALTLAGVARVHERDDCTFDLLKAQLDELLFDADGYVARNLTRMKILAQFGHRRKSYAADLVGKFHCLTMLVMQKSTHLIICRGAYVCCWKWHLVAQIRELKKHVQTEGYGLGFALCCNCIYRHHWHYLSLHDQCILICNKKNGIWHLTCLIRQTDIFSKYKQDRRMTHGQRHRTCSLLTDMLTHIKKFKFYVFTHGFYFIYYLHEGYSYKQVLYEDSDDSDEEDSLLLRPWCGIVCCSSSCCEGVVAEVVVVDDDDEVISLFKNISEVRLAILIIWVCSIWYLRPFRFLYRFLQFPSEQV